MNLYSNMPDFTPEELSHYNRHLILPEIGLIGQTKLKQSAVLVIGAGGLGCPALQYLAAAGVGHIGIVDGDVVDTSNLHRQVLYGMQDVGRPKVEAAAERLSALNPHIRISYWQEYLTSENALSIFSGFDLVLDGTDNFPTRYLVNDACVLSDKINVYGSIFRFEGQVAVFNALRADGSRGPNYRDLFPEPPAPDTVPNCAEAGVLGVLPGIIGSLQANEAIKLITAAGDALDGKLMLFDALSLTSRILKIRSKVPRIQINQLIDYELFCGIETKSEAIPQLAVKDFERRRLDGNAPMLWDVREPYEYEICNLGGLLIPIGEVAQRLAEIPRDKEVVVHCRTGVRSEKAILMLKEQHGYQNLVNLTGGILAYAKEVDSSMQQY
ncbi:MAG: molybdopterin-synthase adenylyltransferase MoeB [Saprospiraceae bacterium]|nr:molybdopterin-synthase adenylyltransferase MoeB [Saprospiraceae bacterium]